MSDDRTENPIPENPGLAGERESSRLALRDSTTAITESAALDPANQSLLDALRITYRLLMAGMIALAGLYLLSGFQPINEGERGVSLVFGKIQNPDLTSGFQFSFPPPIGEMVRVSTAIETIEITDAFFPHLRDRDKTKPLNELVNSARGSLDPNRDGSLITADRNLAHTRWTLSYERDNTSAFLQNISAEHEKEIITAAVERGVTQAIAGVTIDDLLKQTQGGTQTVTNRARQIAQQMLDKLDSGIAITTLNLQDQSPPLALMRDFDKVGQAQSEANTKRQEAEAKALNLRNETAGRAAPVLLELIDEYERATVLNEQDTRERTLADMDAVMMGESIEVARAEGTDVVPADLVSGDVTRVISEAQQDALDMVSEARTDLQIFRAKLSQFRGNSRLTLHREWSDAVDSFMARDNVQVLYVPPGSDTIELLINRDPQIMREIQKRIKERELERANDEAFENRMDDRYKLNSSEEAVR